MDKDAAAKYADDHAEATPQGQCAKYVRKALEAGGADLSKHPYSAKDYGPFLTGQGMQPVPQAGYLPRKGDVVVIQNYRGGDVNGHIALYDGAQWVSDFKQRDIWAGPGYRANQPPMQVYRP